MPRPRSEHKFHIYDNPASPRWWIWWYDGKGKRKRKSTKFEKNLYSRGRAQDEINRIIFEELVIGNIEEKSRSYLLSIINKYNIDGVILGCTELPLILKKSISDIPLIDTVEVHVNAALEHALDLN